MVFYKQKEGAVMIFLEGMHHFLNHNYGVISIISAYLKIMVY